MAIQLNEKQFELESPIKDEIDFPFHDDQILGINLDLEKMIVSVKIQQLNWIPIEKKEALKFLPNGGVVYQASKGRILEMRIFCDHGKVFVKDCLKLNIGTIVGHDIFDAFIESNEKTIVFRGPDFNLAFKFTKYEIWEMK